MNNFNPPTSEKVRGQGNFISLDSFPFSAFDDVWVLNGLGTKGGKVNFDTLNKGKLPFEEQKVIRLTLALQATRLSVSCIQSTLRAITSVPIADLSITSIKSAWKQTKHDYKSKLRSFYRCLYAYDKKRFKELSDFIEKVKIKKKEPKIFDLKMGALSDVEHLNFTNAMNEKSKEIMKLSDFKFTNYYENEGLRAVTSIRNFLAARFVQVLVRRPVNIVQLKWSDISPDASTFTNNGSEVLFSDDDELKVRMYKAKGGFKFREDIEPIPLILNNYFSKELITYRKAYLTLLKRNIPFDLTDDELFSLFNNLPVFFCHRLFKTEFPNKGVLFSSVSSNGSGYHAEALTLITSIKNLFVSLGVVSDRSNKYLNIGNNRLRHTVGTLAARNNIPTCKIAQLMGNTTASASVYVSLSNEARVRIDNDFVANDFLIRAFTSSISTSIDRGEISILDTFEGEVGKSKNIINCSNCERSKPLACYGCGSFSALTTADHSVQKSKALDLYNSRLKNGDSPIALLELKKQIIYIDATVNACALAVKGIAK